MAITTRSKPAPRPPAPGELEEVVTVLARVLTRLVVHVSRGPHAASFRSIAVRELRVASEAEIDLIEKFLTGHGGT
jgi:hypothetical protein